MCVLAAGCAIDARPPLTYDLVYGADAPDYRGRSLPSIQWLDDGVHYVERRDGVLMKVHAASGEAAPAYDHERLAELLVEPAGLEEETAARLAKRPAASSDDYGAHVVKHDETLYFVRLSDGFIRELVATPEEKRNVTLSPDGERVGFVAENNLYTVAGASGSVVQLTTDGSDAIFNGILDWVYQEEVFGRGTWKAYWWSPDSTQIAFLRLDDSNVPVYPLVDKVPTHPTVEQQRYPKAGDPNPIVKCGIVPAAGGDTRWLPLEIYETEADAEIVVTGVGWKDDTLLQLCVKQREALWLDLLFVDVEQNNMRRVLQEDTLAWTSYYGLPHWLEDDTFLWFSARDGWKHLYQYRADGSFVRRVTKGAWEARRLHGVDEDNGAVYVSGTYDTHAEEHLYRVSLRGGDPERLTAPGYSHRITFSPTCTQFVDRASSVTTPPRMVLRRAIGTPIRTLAEHTVPTLQTHRYSPPEILRIEVDNGRTLNAEIVRPASKSPFERWPVLVMTYAGPHGPVVSNSWLGSWGMYKQLLAQNGICVWSIDPHSASGEGAVSAWTCYQKLGVEELADIEASLRWLADHEPVDLDRVGISGYSYGGFMVCYALTHSDMFKVGLAGGSVTDWRNYDSIYTERFMRTPENNQEGYEQSSCLNAAADVRGRLLLVHGLLDDNVHVSNTLQMADKLQQSEREFDLMIYPQDKHGLRRGHSHFRRLQWEWLLGNL
jgi:dipeptidyl-peptidase-4